MWRLFLVISCATILCIIASNNIQVRRFVTHSIRPKSKYKVAILFFGLTRSVNETRSSIQKNILSPLTHHGISYRIFVHTYEVNGRYINKRARENSSSLKSEWELVHPDFVHVEYQEGVLQRKSDFLRNVESYGYAWGSPETTRNALLSLHSQKMVFNLLLRSNYTCDGILILRPDLVYVDPLDVPLLLYSTHKNIVVTPNWQLWGGRNDRFAYGAASAIQLYANRMDAVINYCELFNMSYHSEKMLKWYLDGGYSVVNGQISISQCFTGQRAQRMRSNGIISGTDLDLKGRLFKAQITSNISLCNSSNVNEMVRR